MFKQILMAMDLLMTLGYSYAPKAKGGAKNAAKGASPLLGAAAKVVDTRTRGTLRRAMKAAAFTGKRERTLQLIAPGDVRRNYVLIGSLWTNGKIPGFDPAPQVQQIGSTQLANATMETYVQFPTANCFSCHSGSPGNGLGLKCGGGLSHIYGDLVPLFK